MSTRSQLPTAAMLSATIAITSLCLAAPAPAYDTVEVIQHNTTIVVNGWRLSGDEIIRRSDGVVKVVGHAHASNDGRICNADADKIVLDTEAERITFEGRPRVEMGRVVHVGAHGADLVYDYRHDRWSAD